MIANLTHNNRVEADLGDAARPSAAHAERWAAKTACRQAKKK